jgi:hypothetical protein
MSLTINTSYYISVLARNNAGLYSDTVVTDGVLYLFSTAINQASKEEFKVYPNPVKDKLYFSKTISYYLFDIRGKILATGIDDYIDMTAFSAGTYFLKTDEIVVRIIKD